MNGITPNGPVPGRSISTLPVLNGVTLTVSSTVDIVGSVRIDAGGNSPVLAIALIAGKINMQGSSLHASVYGNDREDMGDVTQATAGCSAICSSPRTA